MKNFRLCSTESTSSMHFEITSGGTTEIIFGRAVWRMGYWGNGKNIEMMNAFYKLVASYKEES